MTIIIITATKIGELLWCSNNNTTTISRKTFLLFNQILAIWHFTNELPCNLDVVKIWILVVQSQSVTIKGKIGLPCLLMTDDWQVVVNSFSSQWIYSVIGQLRVFSLVLAPEIIIVGVWSINRQLWTKISWLHLIVVNLKGKARYNCYLCTTSSYFFYFGDIAWFG